MSRRAILFFLTATGLIGLKFGQFGCNSSSRDNHPSDSRRSSENQDSHISDQRSGAESIHASDSARSPAENRILPERPTRDLATATTTPVFEDITKFAGLLNRHHKPTLDPKLDNIMAWVASVGAAAAAADYDRDGWIDLFVTDSAKGTPNHLYRNNRDGTFTDVAARAGLADWNNDQGTAMDAVWGDYDNDGWPDLYVVRWGEDILFRNNADGTFTNVTPKLFRRRDGSPGMQWANGCAAIWLDFNLDGRLDLYIGNYFDEYDLWNLTTTRIMHDDFENSRNAGRNFLFRQNADGSFTECAAEMGVDDTGWTLAVGAADLNNDGWPDIYAADDFGPDQLFLNGRGGPFQNVSATALGHDTKKGMNVDFGDVNNDGWLDIFVTNITTAEYLQEGNMLWYNNGIDPATGDLTFTDISLEAGVFDGGWGWGGKFLDYDNDGDLDLFSVNGFISAGEGSYWYDLASWTVLGQDSAEARNWPAIGTRTFSGYERNRLWRNDGNLAFTERAEEVGLGSRRDGRGIVCFDFDNDGDLDLFVANQDQEPNFYRNNARAATDDDRNWLLVRLEGDPSTGITRDAIGARVTIVTPAQRLIRERDGGNGYAGQSDPRLHFGLGRERQATLMEVRWPDGGLQYIENVAANQIVRVVQDPERYVNNTAFSVNAPRPARVNGEAHGHDIDPATTANPAEMDRLIGRLERELRARPDSYRIASAYRTACAEAGKHDRAIEFLKRLVQSGAGEPAARIHLACAYVDKIRTCGGIAAIVSKGTLARKALDQLDEASKAKPDLWEIYYCRAQNHLHWPRSLLHSKDAISDFRRCIELQRRSGDESMTPYFVRTYVGLGDAYVKDKDYAAARAAWREGLDRFPEDSDIKARLSLTDDSALLRFVEDQRSLERRIDTDLGFLESADATTQPK
ncbi:MAG: VCBS repeat-containing protein [Phycisphaerae bacterium]|nr:VCBS repeat-containing protein [Phycisphaerae bacterium]